MNSGSVFWDDIGYIFYIDIYIYIYVRCTSVYTLDDILLTYWCSLALFYARPIIGATLSAGERCDLPWSERQLPALWASVPHQSHRQHLAHPGCRLCFWRPNRKGLTCNVWSACMGKKTVNHSPVFRTNAMVGLRDALLRFQQNRAVSILEFLMRCKWNGTFIYEDLIPVDGATLMDVSSKFFQFLEFSRIYHDFSCSLRLYGRIHTKRPCRLQRPSS